MFVNVDEGMNDNSNDNDIDDDDRFASSATKLPVD